MTMSNLLRKTVGFDCFAGMSSFISSLSVGCFETAPVVVFLDVLNILFCDYSKPAELFLFHKQNRLSGDREISSWKAKLVTVLHWLPKILWNQAQRFFSLFSLQSSMSITKDTADNAGTAETRHSGFARQCNEVRLRSVGSAGYWKQRWPCFAWKHQRRSKGEIY